MEAWLSGIFEQLPLVVLFVIIAAALAVLVKGADILVDQAVSLSVKWGVPKMLIGATIVSLGTTLPEVSVSVIAAIQGAPGLALGNAVGSIIADTGLILGLAVVIGRVPVDRTLVSRQSWIQFASSGLLVLVCIPYLRMGKMFSHGGRLPQLVGFILLALLVVYILRSITWSKAAPPDAIAGSTVTIDKGVRPGLAILGVVIGIALVVIGSRVLIPAVEETALRLHIPDAIIAATLVAFGTSLPELATAIASVRKGHGELALGNVLGADVLNVLFVSGASAAVTKGGLTVPPEFFYLFFPSMIFVVTVLRVGVSRTKNQFSKAFGFILLAAYVTTVVLGYVVPGGSAPTLH
ncbi:MAG: sodium:calcium antiporter [Spirochaetales bacterium]|nr:sodium:calcium antiporter [Spirochaetales bacterium]